MNADSIAAGTPRLSRGAATSNCVEATARDGWSHDYYIVVADDCCAQGNLQRHEASLLAMDGPIAVLAGSSEILDAWSGGGS